MTVSAASSASAANTPQEKKPASETAKKEVEEQFNRFLKLLTAQVKNQDPLTPLDSTQFVNQLATFSGLEQQVQTNSLLESILKAVKESDAKNTKKPAA